ncbi:NAD(P)/FAD-dependent oxidoreductase [Pseudoclavibacter endophyticus]|nr:FAD-dependent oxidoreductase [Pseudoclavibacter endophyticus]
MERTESIAALPVPLSRPDRAELPRRVDVVVVGGGLTGLFTALRLRETGRRVVVLEACRAGWAQSSRSLGLIREQGREAIEAAAMRRANRSWQTLAGALGPDLGWIRGGHVSVARDDAAMQRVRDWGEVAREHDVRFEVLTREALRERMPWLSVDVVGAGYTPDDGHVDPSRATASLLMLCRRAGVEVFEGAEVQGIDVAAGRVTGVSLPGAEIRASDIVVAAGAWSSRLLRTCGVHLPIHVGRGTVGLTVPAPPITRASVWDVGGVGFRQSADGRIVFGLGGYVDVDVHWEDVAEAWKLLPTLVKSRGQMSVRIGRELVRDVGGLLARRELPSLPFETPRVNGRQVTEGSRRLAELVPELEGVDCNLSWGGVIDATPDFLPIVGGASIDGLALIVGTSGHGLGLAPALGDGVARLIDTGSSPAYLDAFASSRFDR